ncbi:Gti1/Pac2 family-domain-containing protein [Russula earlei]|uniref:Gti1/Pac2 family-domain-containing protein n=1 Tax=Russula earlei TaxID=71964 RepID=A0ACC0U2J2_9AGAM|nr:Gti1/Pac2 family-domain-containing protein [Russula earlei]
MQRPTHNRLHVRDARDAHTVFEAVRQGLLRPVTRRLNEVERSMYITSGAIFVWEESDDDLGLKRWTDGRVWSQSRMREPYLFYDERLPSDEARGNDHQSSGNFRFVDGIARSGPISPALSHYDRSEHHPMGLVKQAYSAWVLDNPEARPRKWHLTAYFTYVDLHQIPTVDQDPVLRGVAVPVGVYRSGKARSRNSDAGLGASPPSSPPPYTRGQAGPGVPSQASASNTADSSTALPPLQMAVTPQPFDPRMPRRGNDSRHAEDQRIIQMLNSRHVM